MSRFRLLAGRELRALVRSPALLFVVAAFHLFHALVYRRLVSDAIGAAAGAGAGAGPRLAESVVAPAFAGLVFVLVLFVPLLTMRSLADERRSGFEDLLASLPFSSTEVVLAKFAAVFTATLALTLPPALLPACLAGPAAPEWGVVASATLGLVLAGATFAAAGLWASSATGNPVLAAAGALTGLLVLFFLDRLGGVPGAFLSLRLAFDPFARGVVGTASVARALVLCATFLFLATQTLELRRRTR